MGDSAGKGGGSSSAPAYNLTGVEGPEATQTAYVQPQTTGTGTGPDWATMLQSFGMGGASHGGIGGGAPALSHVSFEQPPVKVPALGFALTPGQSRLLRSLNLDDAGSRRYLMQQLLSGNPTYGPYTVQQVQAARGLMTGVGASGTGG